MKLIYLTSQKYPSSKVDPFFWRSMAEAFAEILGLNFIFLVRGKTSDDLGRINTMSIKVPRRFRTVFYFFYMPVFVWRHGWNGQETVFFSADPYLLSILIFWRKMLGSRYLICSDWHQLFDDWKDKYMARNSDYLISTSSRLKSLLVSKCGIDSNKIKVAYGGVNKNIFAEKAKKGKEEHRVNLGLPIDAFLVGYIGGLKSVGQEKGIDTMIKSLPFLDQRIKMVFVGGSKEGLSEYVTLANDKNVEDKCIFIEKQPFEKAVEYEMAMDVLVIPYPNHPHFRDYGFPLKVWEYMASGRPIVYSALEIIKEVLDGKATSFESGNASNLADAILSVYRNREQAERVSTNNSKEIVGYTWKARAQNIVDFINNK